MPYRRKARRTRRVYNRRRYRRHNPRRRVMYYAHRHNDPDPGRRRRRRNNPGRRRYRRRNPLVLGQNVTAGRALTLVGGGLVGVTLNRMVVPALPGALISSPWGRVGASLAVSLAGGWAASQFDRDFGSAVLFGGLMMTGSNLLNALGVGRQFALSGGLGYFTPAQFPLPMNPIRAAIPGPVLPAAAPAPAPAAAGVSGYFV